MHYLTIGQALELYTRIIEQSGGSFGVRDLGALESALAQPRMTFGEKDLYPTIVEKAAALAYSLIMNHPFVDGNKRTGHAAMEVFLVLNGCEVDATTDEQEQVLLQMVSGQLKRDEFTEWVRLHVVPRKTNF